MNFLTWRLTRLLFAFPFMMFGLIYIFNAKLFVSLVPAFLPGGILWVYIAGILLVGCGLSLTLDAFAILGCKILALLLVIVIITIHLPAVLTGLSSNLTPLLKDIALLGATLTYAHLYDEGILPMD